MIDQSKLVMIVVAATLIATSPALARSLETRRPAAARFDGFYAPAAPRARVTVDRNDPALTGGGSLGYNQRVEQGF
jgi:hypothetical protein